MDAIIQFASLEFDTILRVVDKFIIELEALLDEKRVSLNITSEARHWLAEHGFDPLMGARPMQRLIRDRVKRALADELLFGKLARGGNVVLAVVDDDLDIQISKTDLVVAEPIED